MTCLFVDHLTVIDCALLDVQRGLVGESFIVDVELEGELDAHSMVLDFSAVKKQLKTTIDRSVDHTLLVPKRAHELLQKTAGRDHHLVFRSELGAIEHRSPVGAVTLVDALEIDHRSLADHLEPILAATVPPNIAELRLRLRSEPIDGAYYHYTHGLKKHNGHCQRIAHGHRSRLVVEIDGHRVPCVEQRVALRWTDIYLGTREDLCFHANGRIGFAYSAPQGRFELVLPESQVDLIDGDTTVERIAEHLASTIAAEHPGKPVRVRAYEGVHKGAVAQACVHQTA
jgi:6-pyruvoyl-tetrahydropterin synthase